MVQNILKTYDKQLNQLIIFNIILFIIVIYQFKFIWNIFDIFKVFGISLISYFPSVLFIDVIPSKYKNKIIFTSSEDLIISKLENENIKKIDFNKINQKYNYSRKNASEQEKLWYSIYRKHRDEPGIWHINQNFLICRDSTFTLIILLIPISLISLFFKINLLSFGFWLMIMALEILLFIICSNRFSDSLIKSILIEETYHLKK